MFSLITLQSATIYELTALPWKGSTKIPQQRCFKIELSAVLGCDIVSHDHSLSYKLMLSCRFISSAISSPAALLRNERALSKQNYYHFTPSVVVGLSLLVTTNETRIQCTLVRVLRLHAHAEPSC